MSCRDRCHFLDDRRNHFCTWPLLGCAITAADEGPGRVPRELFPPPALGECLDGVLARRLVTVGRGAILAVAVS
jgi:hypothetical protein